MSHLDLKSVFKVNSINKSCKFAVVVTLSTLPPSESKGYNSIALAKEFRKRYVSNFFSGDSKEIGSVTTTVIQDCLFLFLFRPTAFANIEDNPEDVRSLDDIIFQGPTTNLI